LQRAKTLPSTAAAVEPRPSVVLMNRIYSSDVLTPELAFALLRKGISEGRKDAERFLFRADPPALVPHYIIGQYFAWISETRRSVKTRRSVSRLSNSEPVQIHGGTTHIWL